MVSRIDSMLLLLIKCRDGCGLSVTGRWLPAVLSAHSAWSDTSCR